MTASIFNVFNDWLGPLGSCRDWLSQAISLLSRQPGAYMRAKWFAPHWRVPPWAQLCCDTGRTASALGRQNANDTSSRRPTVCLYHTTYWEARIGLEESGGRLPWKQLCCIVTVLIMHTCMENAEGHEHVSGGQHHWNWDSCFHGFLLYFYICWPSLGSLTINHMNTMILIHIQCTM